MGKKLEKTGKILDILKVVIEATGAIISAIGKSKGGK
jgi:hypothetical protein